MLQISDPTYYLRLHAKLSRRGRMPLWTVYDVTTAEYPGKFVARMFVTLPSPRPTRYVIVHPTLSGLRAVIPSGLICLCRHPLDPPEIIETWH